jgi:hypothetical protein
MVSLDRNKLVREFMIAPFSRWIVTDACPCVTFLRHILASHYRSLRGPDLRATLVDVAGLMW